MLAAALFVLFRPQSAAALLEGKDIQVVSVLYNDALSSTSGVCPHTETGTDEWDYLQSILRGVQLRRRGFSWDGHTEFPGYSLYFYDAQGPSLVTLYFTKSGLLYCGHSVYRIVSPEDGETWHRLGIFYQELTPGA